MRNDTKVATTAVDDHLLEAKGALRVALALDHLLSPGDSVPVSVRGLLDELDADQDMFDALDMWALETYATKRVTFDGTTDIVSVTVVTGTGGPHSQFTIEPNGDVTAEAWGWGRDGHRTTIGYAPTLASWLCELYEMVEVQL